MRKTGTIEEDYERELKKLMQLAAGIIDTPSPICAEALESYLLEKSSRVSFAWLMVRYTKLETERTEYKLCIEEALRIARAGQPIEKVVECLSLYRSCVEK